MMNHQTNKKNIRNICFVFEKVENKLDFKYHISTTMDKENDWQFFRWVQIFSLFFS